MSSRSSRTVSWSSRRRPPPCSSPICRRTANPARTLANCITRLGPLKDFVRRADAEGFGIHIHAIGDRAVRVGLDAFADARAQGSKRAYSFAHLELIDPADVPRFHELDVTASLQLQWARPDNYASMPCCPTSAPNARRSLYPERTLWAAGARVAGGSDWDVSTYNPFEAMAIAMSRDQSRGTGTRRAWKGRRAHAARDVRRIHSQRRAHAGA